MEIKVTLCRLGLPPHSDTYTQILVKIFPIICICISNHLNNCICISNHLHLHFQLFAQLHLHFQSFAFPIIRICISNHLHNCICRTGAVVGCLWTGQLLPILYKRKENLLFSNWVSPKLLPNSIVQGVWGIWGSCQDFEEKIPPSVAANWDSLHQDGDN